MILPKHVCLPAEASVAKAGQFRYPPDRISQESRRTESSLPSAPECSPSGCRHRIVAFQRPCQGCSTRVKQKILKAATDLRIREHTKYTKNRGKIKESLACVLLQLVEFVEIVYGLRSDRINEDSTIKVFSRLLEILCGLMR
jgi:hypothetical protein